MPSFYSLYDFQAKNFQQRLENNFKHWSHFSISQEPWPADNSFQACIAYVQYYLFTWSLNIVQYIKIPK